MKILLVGNGAREHAMAEATVKSGGELFAFMKAKNPGIAGLSKEFVLGDVNNGSAVAKWASERRIEVAVIGPEAPLERGVVDELEKSGVKCASPKKAAARLEWDKSFTRNLMQSHRIPGCPEFAIFSEKTKDEIAGYIKALNNEVAVKPAGLTGGKGVKIAGEHLRTAEESTAYAQEIIMEGIGGLREVVIEEKLVGEEFTLQAFVDGKKVAGMPCVQDHKRAFENDSGPNTGGMGSYSDSRRILPFMREADYENAVSIMKKVVDALRATNAEYRGALYGQFMLTRDGPKVIEFNARFGDPEAMNVLPIMKTSYTQMLQQMVDGKVSEPEFEPKATVCKYLVPDGYPDNPKAKQKITVNEQAIKKLSARTYYASVSEENGVICTSSSRAVGVLGIANSIDEAEKIAEAACSQAQGPLFHRKDIGTRKLVQRRVDHMKQIRG